MKKVIKPIEKKSILQELNSETFVRKTNFANHEIYVLNHLNSPNTLLEIGRLRELTFRMAGGGTGKELDLDDFDTRSEAYYNQLIVWDPDALEIIGGYRFIKGKKVIVSKKHKDLATNSLFHFSKQFETTYLPQTIELGRSFVQPGYQPSSGNRKGIFSLDNLWDGLGALVVDNEEIKYFFGKVTMYLDYPKQARDLILTFIGHYFPDNDGLVTAKSPLDLYNDTSFFIKEISTLNYEEAYKLLTQHVRKLNTSVPPLISAYMSLSSTMKSFGTALNKKFGDVEETGILISINDIFEQKKERHINSYLKEKNGDT
ncbi:MAG: GNAT family N-acyltransferase [Bacteroidota bacterium]|nr:GNAT family N-acyltransferase [Bacteroidota bacterium]MEC9187559.1 GNAT family N-acyltransferase [Bacteroidota bacterium]